MTIIDGSLRFQTRMLLFPAIMFILWLGPRRPLTNIDQVLFLLNTGNNFRRNRTSNAG